MSLRFQAANRVPAPAAPPQPLTYVAGRGAVIEDAGGFTILSLDTPPPVGSYTLRQDGRITADFSDAVNTEDATYDITYTRDNGGPEQVTVPLTLRRKLLLGDAPGDRYLPEVDASNAVVFEPVEGTRFIHVAADGLTLADIQALEGNPVFNQRDMRTDPATGTDGTFYGGTPALALEHKLAFQLLVNIRNSSPDFTPIALFYKRGDVFNGAEGEFGQIGHSALHPIFVGTYGSGDMPYLGTPEDDPAFDENGKAPQATGGSFVVVQGIRYAGANAIDGSGSFICYDGMFASFRPDGNTNAPCNIAGLNYFQEMVTVRRTRIYDTWNPVAKAATWGTGDRLSGLKVGRSRHVLIEWTWIAESGGGLNYRMDKDASGEKSFENQSQGHYNGANISNFNTESSCVIASGGSASQNRSGVVMEGCVFIGCNDGVTQGPAPADLRGWNPDGSGKDHGWLGYAGCFIDVVITQAGWRGHEVNQANGVRVPRFVVQRENVSCVGSYIVNRGDPIAVLSQGSDLGPGMFTGYNQNEGVAYTANTPDSFRESGIISSLYPGHALVVSNWNRGGGVADANVGSVPQADRDAANINAYADQLIGTSGSNYETLNDYAKTLDEPYLLVPEILDYLRAPYGETFSTRTVGTTVYFAPENGLPIFRGNHRRNWSTKDRPGHAPGDIVDTQDHDLLQWNFQNKNKLVDFIFGAGTKVDVCAGVLDTATLSPDAAGNSLSIRDGAKVRLDGYTGPNLLVVDARDSRLHLRGAVTGRVETTLRQRAELLIDEGASLVTNGNLTVHGYSTVAFEGASGGAASLDIGSGDTLSFKPTARFKITGLTRERVPVGSSGGATVDWNFYIRPRPGALLTGGTSGATGIIRGIVPTDLGRAVIVYVDTLIGAFQELEDIICERELGEVLLPSGMVGLIDSIQDVTLGAVREMQTGVYGNVAPNVASSVTLGGALEVDVTGLPSGSYPLIVADTITGAFASETITGGSGAISRPDANTVLLTV